MSPFDQLLIDPTEAELVRALSAAARVASRRLRERRLVRTDEAWRRSVRALPHERQGGQIWRAGRGGLPAAFVNLAWWTDHLGRRHARVTGLRLDSQNQNVARASPFDDWPLWQVYPERVLLCERGGRKELLAVCACGAVGTPEALAWMGECCGPCHDRREEGGRAPEGRPTLLRGAAGAEYRIAFTPDGRELVSLGGGGVFLWDTATGAGRPLRASPSGHAAGFALAPDGATVALAWESGRVILCDRRGKRLRGLGRLPLYHYGMAFSPDGRYLAFGGPTNALLDLSVSGGPAVAWLPGRVVARLAFAPDGRHLYALDFSGALFRVGVPGGAEVMLDAGLVTGDERGGEYDSAVVAVACSPDGRWLAASAGNSRGRRFRAYELATGRSRELQPQPASTAWALAFAPDGRTLAWAGWGGCVRLWDVVSGAQSGVLTWEAEAFGTCAVAFSPDGTTLAAATAGGTIRLWPWRQLLGEA